MPRRTLVEITALKAVAAVYVMTLDERRPVYERQQELLAELVARLTDDAPAGLQPPHAAAWRRAPDDAARRRAVIDQVASLTDVSTVDWHQRLCRPSP